MPMHFLNKINELILTGGLLYIVHHHVSCCSAFTRDHNKVNKTKDQGRSQKKPTEDTRQHGKS